MRMTPAFERAGARTSFEAEEMGSGDTKQVEMSVLMESQPRGGLVAKQMKLLPATAFAIEEAQASVRVTVPFQ